MTLVAIPSVAAAVSRARSADADDLETLGFIVDQAADALAPVFDYLAWSYQIKNRPRALAIVSQLGGILPQYAGEMHQRIASAGAAIYDTAGSSDVAAHTQAQLDQYEQRRANIRELAQFFRGTAATGQIGTVAPAEAAANAAIEGSRAEQNTREVARDAADKKNPIRLFTGETDLGGYLHDLGIPDDLVFWVKVAAISVPVVAGLIGVAYVVRSFK